MRNHRLKAICVTIFASAALAAWGEDSRSSAVPRSPAPSARTSFDSIHARYTAQSILSRLTQNSRRKIPSRVVQEADGYSYEVVIPYVTRANDTRTNLGINNFTPSSLVKGDKPEANVLVVLVDSVGEFAGFNSYVVRTNELVQVNNVITDLQGDVDTGWLDILSDEPIDVWASVIFNSTNDPSILTGSGAAGSRLVIQSSVKSDTFQSSLVILNLGDSGEVTVSIFDNQGQQVSTKTKFVQSFGLDVDNDVRDEAVGTYGQIVIEAADSGPFLIASSIVKSKNGTGAFFPAASFPPPTFKSIAGIWDGTLSGTSINAQVSVTLFQEGGGFFGSMQINSGDFPIAGGGLSISGSSVNDPNYQYLFESTRHLDSTVGLFSLFLYAPPLTGDTMSGKLLYVDETGAHETGTFSLQRVDHIIVF